jgi:hypothetical protein
VVARYVSTTEEVVDDDVDNIVIPVDVDINAGTHVVTIATVSIATMHVVMRHWMGGCDTCRTDNSGCSDCGETRHYSLCHRSLSC